MTSPPFFQFEADFVEALRCVPMGVRLKLDTCGIKLKLSEWNKFSREQRKVLVEMPCQTDEEVNAYREHLQHLVLASTGHLPTKLTIEPHPEWANNTVIPSSVREQTKTLNVTFTLDQWAKLTPLQRFALIKLSRSDHENHNFLPALEEFHLD
ncbi:MAG: nitrate reductase associated protein [Gloeobacterales cyanobacterium]